VAAAARKHRSIPDAATIAHNRFMLRLQDWMDFLQKPKRPDASSSSISPDLDAFEEQMLAETNGASGSEQYENEILVNAIYQIRLIESYAYLSERLDLPKATAAAGNKLPKETLRHGGTEERQKAALTTAGRRSSAALTNILVALGIDVSPNDAESLRKALGLLESRIKTRLSALGAPPEIIGGESLMSDNSYSDFLSAKAVKPGSSGIEPSVPKPVCLYSSNYREIVIDGKPLSATELQAAVLKALNEASDGLSTKELHDETGCRKVSDAFRLKDGPQLWKTLIMTSTRGGQGLYKLKHKLISSFIS